MMDAREMTSIHLAGRLYYHNNTTTSCINAEEVDLTLIANSTPPRMIEYPWDHYTCGDISVVGDTFHLQCLYYDCIYIYDSCLFPFVRKLTFQLSKENNYSGIIWIRLEDTSEQYDGPYWFCDSFFKVKGVPFFD